MLVGEDGGRRDQCGPEPEAEPDGVRGVGRKQGGADRGERHVQRRHEVVGQVQLVGGMEQPGPDPELVFAGRRVGELRGDQQESDPGDPDGEGHRTDGGGEFAARPEDERRQEEHPVEGHVEERHPGDERDAQLRVEVDGEPERASGRQPVRAAVDEQEPEGVDSRQERRGSQVRPARPGQEWRARS